MRALSHRSTAVPPHPRSIHDWPEPSGTAMVSPRVRGAFMVVVVAICGVLLVVLIHDLFQRKRAILRNFPIVGHFRYWIESIGPELRQYLVAGNNEERPFSRDQRT